MKRSYHNSPKATGGRAGERLRFVVLHHRLPDCEHWDLMIEDEGKLLTWQLPIAPNPPIDRSIAARRIVDHRLAYLDYEGPISGDRGSVRRFDTGGVTMVERSPSLWVFRLCGRRLAGAFQLRRTSAAGDEWTFSAIGDRAGVGEADTGLNRAPR